MALACIHISPTPFLLDLVGQHALGLAVVRTARTTMEYNPCRVSFLTYHATCPQAPFDFCALRLKFDYIAFCTRSRELRIRSLNWNEAAEIPVAWILREERHRRASFWEITPRKCYFRIPSARLYSAFRNSGGHFYGPGFQATPRNALPLGIAVL